MIVAKLHDNLDTPLNIPAFNVFKKPKKDSLSDVISGAALAFTKAMSGSPAHPTSRSTDATIFPGNSVTQHMQT